MPGVKRPRMPKPKIPKIKKPTISKTRRIRKKLPALSVKKIDSKTKTRSATHRSVNKKKHYARRSLGTCYLQSGCRNVLAKNVSKTQCKKMGGKSWKISGGICECLVK